MILDRFWRILEDFDGFWMDFGRILVEKCDFSEEFFSKKICCFLNPGEKWSEFFSREILFLKN